MAGLSEEAKLLHFIQENVGALSSKVDLRVVEDYLSIIHDYVEEHNEPVNSPESEIWVLERFVQQHPEFSMSDARKLMDMELAYWDAVEEGDEEEEEGEFAGFDDEQ